MKEPALLDNELVAGIIQAQFPALAPVRAIYLGEGCDSSAFEVNGEWVFRFPKRPEVERQLLTEIRTLAVLSEWSPVPIPAFCFHGQPVRAFPHQFGGYPKLPGRPAIQVDPARVSFGQLAPTIGRFLSWLHAFQVADAARLGVERHEIESLIEETRAEALGDFELVNRVAPGEPLDEWHKYLSAGPDPVARSRTTPALLHNDLAAEHILVDPAGQAVTGIIDWSDLAIGDRAADFAGVFHWGGRAFVDAVLSSYTGPIDDFVVPRARFLAACRGVGDIAFGLERDRPEYTAAGIRALRLAVAGDLDRAG